MLSSLSDVECGNGKAIVEEEIERLRKRKRADFEKERRQSLGQNFKVKDAERKKKAKAMEELAKICLQCSVVTPEVVDNLDIKYHDRISEELEYYITKNSNVNPAANKSCVNCFSTCGPQGCIKDCECFLENKVCVHACASYVCNAMPHKILQKQVEAGLEYLGKQGKYGKSVAMTGLQVLEDCKEGEIVMEYTGPRVNKSSYYSRQRMTEANVSRYYMEAGDDIIKGDLGNEARFVNSSCKPNCMYYSWQFPDGKIRVFLTTLKKIKKGTFLHAKYNWNNNIEKCLCQQTLKCRAGEVFI